MIIVLVGVKVYDLWWLATVPVSPSAFSRYSGTLRLDSFVREDVVVRMYIRRYLRGQDRACSSVFVLLYKTTSCHWWTGFWRSVQTVESPRSV